MSATSNEFKPGYGGLKFGNNFWHGARPHPDTIVRRLEDGNSVSIFGPSRRGKSSLLAEARECLTLDGSNVIWVSLDAEDSLTKTFSAIISSMQQGNSKGIVNNLKGWVNTTDIIPPEFRAVTSAIISGRIDDSSDNFNENHIEALFREIGQQLKSIEPKDKPIIILDELTNMLKNTIDRVDSSETRKMVARLNSFLAMMRHWRSDDVGITMAVCGSISLDWLQRKYGIKGELINDCVPIQIEEMEKEAARELIIAWTSAQSEKKWDEDCITEILNLIPAYYPSVVQLACSVIYPEDISLELLKGPLRDKVFYAFWREFFSQFQKQFEDYDPGDQLRARRLFDAIDKNKDGIIEYDESLKILNEEVGIESASNGFVLIERLSTDYFLSQIPNGVKFTSGLVPAWYKKQL